MSVNTNYSLALSQTVPKSTIQRYQAKPGEKYMCFRQKEYLKQVLKQERAYWVEAEQRMMSEFLKQKRIKLSSDPVDIANQEIEMRYALRGRENRLIKKINSALNRLTAEDNRYGFCNVCYTEIGMRRLELRPTAHLCFDCKTRDEIKENRTSNN